MVPWTHISQQPKRHLDPFTRFCAAHPCVPHTDTQTTLRATSVAIGRTYAMHAVRPNNNSTAGQSAGCVDEQAAVRKCLKYVKIRLDCSQLTSFSLWQLSHVGQ